MGQIINLQFFKPMRPTPDRDTELCRAGDMVLLGIVKEWVAAQEQMMAREGRAMAAARRIDLMEAVEILRGPS